MSWYLRILTSKLLDATFHLIIIIFRWSKKSSYKNTWLSYFTTSFDIWSLKLCSKVLLTFSVLSTINILGHYVRDMCIALRMKDEAREGLISSGDDLINEDALYSDYDKKSLKGNLDIHTAFFQKFHWFLTHDWRIYVHLRTLHLKFSNLNKTNKNIYSTIFMSS